MSWTILTIIYSLALLAIGYYAYTRTGKTVSDYFVAGRGLGTFIILFTIFHSMSSAFIIMGAVSEGYRNGVGMLGVAVGVFWVGILFVIMGSRINLMGRKYDWVTPGDFLGERYYSNAYRLITSIILIYFTVPYIGLQLGGMARSFAAGSGIPVIWSLIFICLVLLIYVVTGGMKAVAWTDAVQGIVQGVVVVLTTILVFHYLPGTMSEIAEQARKIKPGIMGFPGPNMKYTPIAFFTPFLACFGLLAWPHIFARVLAARDRNIFRKLAIGFPLYQIWIVLPITLIAIMAVPVLFGANLSPREANLAFQMAAGKLLPPIFAILVWFAIYSASMSTADSQVLVCSSMFTRDMYQRIFRKNATEKETLAVGRIAVIVLIIVAAIIGYNYPGTLFKLAVKFAFPGYMQILPQMVAGVFWRRATKEGAIAGTIVGTIVVVLTTFVWPNALGVTNLIWGIAFNCATLIIVSLLTSAPPASIIKTFYDEVEEQLRQEKQAS